MRWFRRRQKATEQAPARAAAPQLETPEHVVPERASEGGAQATAKPKRRRGSRGGRGRSRKPAEASPGRKEQAQRALAVARDRWADYPGTRRIRVEELTFVREAQELRATSRTVTYWATADDLTERWLKSGDKDVIQRGLAALETLLEYAQIATPSQWLIRTAMARLAVATGDLDRARRELRLAAASKHPVILKRIDYDPNLKGLGLTSGSS